MKKLLEQTIEQSQKIISQSKDWQQTYEQQANILTENKALLEQFHKQIKNYEHLQFYLAEVSTTPPNIFTVQARYQGQPIATIAITKDNITISTDLYNDTNKKTYNCDFQLKDKDIKAVETIQFLNYFNQELTPKGKIDEQAHIENMLLTEFSKTSSYDKLLTGIQPIKYSNLYYPIPIKLNTKEETGYIPILTRTKVRKLTIIEPMNEKQTPETVLANATSKAVFLLNLLHTNQGQEWYKIMGFHGRVPSHITIKVCIAIPKQLKAKCKEFEPFELKAETDSIEYYPMIFDTNGAEIISIKTTLND